MTDWVPEERNAKTFGPFTLTPLRPRDGGEGAHHVDFGDGRGLRVLPTASKSARARYAVLSGALTDCVAIGANLGPIGATEAFDPVTYVVGRLTQTAIPWESVGSLYEPTIEDWLAHWYEVHCEHVTRPDNAAKFFLDALADDGWEIRRKEADS